MDEGTLFAAVFINEKQRIPEEEKEPSSAATSGGAPALKALGAPLPQMSFCPTGGISAGNADDYLGLSNVACVGGSWVAPAAAVAAGDWAAIETLAREARALA